MATKYKDNGRLDSFCKVKQKFIKTPKDVDDYCKEKGIFNKRRIRTPKEKEEYINKRNRRIGMSVDFIMNNNSSATTKLILGKLLGEDIYDIIKSEVKEQQNKTMAFSKEELEIYMKKWIENAEEQIKESKGTDYYHAMKIMNKTWENNEDNENG